MTEFDSILPPLTRLKPVEFFHGRPQTHGWDLIFELKLSLKIANTNNDIKSKHLKASLGLQRFCLKRKLMHSVEEGVTETSLTVFICASIS